MGCLIWNFWAGSSQNMLLQKIRSFSPFGTKEFLYIWLKRFLGNSCVQHALTTHLEIRIRSCSVLVTCQGNVVTFSGLMRQTGALLCVHKTIHIVNIATAETPYQRCPVYSEQHGRNATHTTEVSEKENERSSHPYQSVTHAEEGKNKRFLSPRRFPWSTLLGRASSSHQIFQIPSTTSFSPTELS